jgi:hypothetical protein
MFNTDFLLHIHSQVCIPAAIGSWLDDAGKTYLVQEFFRPRETYPYEAVHIHQTLFLGHDDIKSAWFFVFLEFLLRAFNPRHQKLG